MSENEVRYLRVTPKGAELLNKATGRLSLMENSALAKECHVCWGDSLWDSLELSKAASKPATGEMWFSRRWQLAEEFKEWAAKNDAASSPLGVITWLSMKFNIIPKEADGGERP
jgi:hypothetical protein